MSKNQFTPRFKKQSTPMSDQRSFHSHAVSIQVVGNPLECYILHALLVHMNASPFKTSHRKVTPTYSLPTSPTPGIDLDAVSDQYKYVMNPLVELEGINAKKECNYSFFMTNIIVSPLSLSLTSSTSSSQLSSFEDGSRLNDRKNKNNWLLHEMASNLVNLYCYNDSNIDFAKARFANSLTELLTNRLVPIYHKDDKDNTNRVSDGNTIICPELAVASLGGNSCKNDSTNGEKGAEVTENEVSPRENGDIYYIALSKLADYPKHPIVTPSLPASVTLRPGQFLFSLSVIPYHDREVIGGASGDIGNGQESCPGYLHQSFTDSYFAYKMTLLYPIIIIDCCDFYSVERAVSYINDLVVAKNYGVHCAMECQHVCFILKNEHLFDSVVITPKTLSQLCIISSLSSHSFYCYDFDAENEVGYKLRELLVDLIDGPMKIRNEDEEKDKYNHLPSIPLPSDPLSRTPSSLPEPKYAIAKEEMGRRNDEMLRAIEQLGLFFEKKTKLVNFVLKNTLNTLLSTTIPSITSSYHNPTGIKPVALQKNSTWLKLSDEIAGWIHKNGSLLPLPFHFPRQHRLIPRYVPGKSIIMTPMHYIVKAAFVPVHFNIDTFGLPPFGKLFAQNSTKNSFFPTFSLEEDQNSSPNDEYPDYFTYSGTILHKNPHDIDQATLNYLGVAIDEGKNESKVSPNGQKMAKNDRNDEKSGKNAKFDDSFHFLEADQEVFGGWVPYFALTQDEIEKGMQNPDFQPELLQNALNSIICGSKSLPPSKLPYTQHVVNGTDREIVVGMVNRDVEGPKMIKLSDIVPMTSILTKTKKALKNSLINTTLCLDQDTDEMLLDEINRYGKIGYDDDLADEDKLLYTQKFEKKSKITSQINPLTQDEIMLIPHLQSSLSSPSNSSTYYSIQPELQSKGRLPLGLTGPGGYYRGKMGAFSTTAKQPLCVANFNDVTGHNYNPLRGLYYNRISGEYFEGLHGAKGMLGESGGMSTLSQHSSSSSSTLSNSSQPDQIPIIQSKYNFTVSLHDCYRAPAYVSFNLAPYSTLFVCVVVDLRTGKAGTTIQDNLASLNALRVPCFAVFIVSSDEDIEKISKGGDDVDTKSPYHPDNIQKIKNDPYYDYITSESPSLLLPASCESQKVNGSGNVKRNKKNKKNKNKKNNQTSQSSKTSSTTSSTTPLNPILFYELGRIDPIFKTIQKWDYHNNFLKHDSSGYPNLRKDIFSPDDVNHQSFGKVVTVSSLPRHSVRSTESFYEGVPGNSYGVLLSNSNDNDEVDGLFKFNTKEPNREDIPKTPQKGNQQQPKCVTNQWRKYICQVDGFPFVWDEIIKLGIAHRMMLIQAGNHELD